MDKRKTTGLLIFFGLMILSMLIFFMWFGNSTEENHNTGAETQKYAKQIGETDKKSSKEAENIIEHIRENNGFADQDMKVVTQAIYAICSGNDEKDSISYDNEVRRFHDVSLLFYLSDILTDKTLKNTDVYKCVNEVRNFMIDKMDDADKRVEAGEEKIAISEMESEISEMTKSIAADKQKNSRIYTEAVENAALERK